MFSTETTNLRHCKLNCRLQINIPKFSEFYNMPESDFKYGKASFYSLQQGTKFAVGKLK
jgi:hypothetical protein